MQGIVWITCRVQDPSPWCECWRAWCDWRLKRLYSGPRRSFPLSDTGGWRGGGVKRTNHTLMTEVEVQVQVLPRWSRSPPCQTWHAGSGKPHAPRPRCPAAIAASLHWSKCWWEGLFYAVEIKTLETEIRKIFQQRKQESRILSDFWFKVDNKVTTTPPSVPLTHTTCPD